MMRRCIRHRLLIGVGEKTTWVGIESGTQVITWSSAVTVRYLGEMDDEIRFTDSTKSSPECPQLAARVFCGNLCLDLREARLAPAGTTIDVNVTMGHVEVIVAPGMEVEVDVSSFLGNVEQHTERDHGSAGRPLVRIVGRVKLGNLELSTLRSGETRRDARRRLRAQRRAHRYLRSQM